MRKTYITKKGIYTIQEIEYNHTVYTYRNKETREFKEVHNIPYDNYIEKGVDLETTSKRKCSNIEKQIEKFFNDLKKELLKDCKEEFKKYGELAINDKCFRDFEELDGNSPLAYINK